MLNLTSVQIVFSVIVFLCCYSLLSYGFNGSFIIERRLTYRTI